jgi:hypothetical protein
VTDKVVVVGLIHGICAREGCINYDLQRVFRSQTTSSISKFQEISKQRNTLVQLGHFLQNIINASVTSSHHSMCKWNWITGSDCLIIGKYPDGLPIYLGEDEFWKHGDWDIEKSCKDARRRRSHCTQIGPLPSYRDLVPSHEEMKAGKVLQCAYIETGKVEKDEKGDLKVDARCRTCRNKDLGYQSNETDDKTDDEIEEGAKGQ